MLTDLYIKDIQEWYLLLRKLGQEELSTDTLSRMKLIENRQWHNNHLAMAMAMMREEYVQDLCCLALRIRAIDSFLSLPWYKRIFSKL